MKKLLIDISSSVPYFRNGVVYGVGRSTLELIEHLSLIENIPFEIEVYTQCLKKTDIRNYIRFKHINLPIPKITFFNKILSFLRIKKLLSNYDLYHIPHNTDLCEIYSNTIFTIHDLIVYRYPEYWNLTDKDKKHFQILAKKCKAIVTCSETSKKDIMKYWNVPSDKVTVIYWGINRNIFHYTKDDGFLSSIGVKGIYYFCSSCNHQRKNLPLLLEAYEQYINDGGIGQLVLLNPLNEYLYKYEKLISERKIVLCYKCSDDKLSILYSNAQCSIILSQYEGFGFPVLESLSCGTMVLSARNSSLEEIGKSYIEYIDRLEKEDISKKLLVYDSKKPFFDKEKIDKYLEIYSWDKCAQRYIDFYKKQLNIK